MAPARQAGSGGGKQKDVTSKVQRSEARVDVAHRLRTASSTPVEPGSLAQEQAGERPAGSIPPASAPDSAKSDEQSDLRLHAAHLSQEVRRQHADLARRQETVNQQLAALDEQRRLLRLWARELELDLGGREKELDKRSAALDREAGRLVGIEKRLEKRRLGLRRAAQKHVARIGRDRQRVQAQDALVENRRRAQQARLQQDQAELETRRDELRRSVQRLLADRQAWESLLDLQVRAMQRHRQALEQREASLQSWWRELADANKRRLGNAAADADYLERQQQVAQYAVAVAHRQAFLDQQARELDEQRERFAEVRRRFDRFVHEAKQAIEDERAQWERKRHDGQDDLDRRRGLLVQQARELEVRRAALERLERELHETQRSSLQHRVAAEEAWARLVGNAGTPEAGSQFNRAREELAAHYRRAEERVKEKQQHLDEARVQLAEQHHEFGRQKERLSEWVAEQRKSLRNEESRLQERMSGLAQRENELAEREQYWQEQCLNYQARIRQLLAELGRVESFEAK